MTDYGDITAWIKITYGSDTLYIHCEDWSYDNKDPSPIIIDYPNFGHYGKTLKAETVTINLTNAYVTNKTDWETLKTQLKAIRNSSTQATLQIRVSTDGATTPTYGYEKYDGTNTTMPVLIVDMKGFTKRYRGNTTQYLIKKITLRQIGALTA